MNSTRLIFLRHADTQKDPNLNAALWGLSESGAAQAKDIAQFPDMQSVDIIYASNEQKTSLTAGPLAQKLEKTIHTLGSFNEVERGDKFLTKEEFEEEKKKQLVDLDYHAFGGESGSQALTRFKEGLDRVVGDNSGKTVLIVTHGTVLNLYFADLLDEYNSLPDRWSKTAFGAYGIVEDGRVVKDII